MTHSVFISYSVDDRHKAEAVCQRLESGGLRCWMASRDVLPGSDWAEAILNAIDSARVLVLLLSHNANVSNHVKREVERAVNRGLVIIPLRVEEVVPSKSLEYLISASQWLDAYVPPFERHLDKLAEVVGAVLRDDGTHVTVPVQLPALQETASRRGRFASGRRPWVFATLAVALISAILVWYLVAPSFRTLITTKRDATRRIPPHVSQLSAVDRAYVAATVDALRNLSESVVGVTISEEKDVPAIRDSVRSELTHTIGKIQVISGTRVRDFMVDTDMALVQYLDPGTLQPVTIRCSNGTLQSIDGPFSVSRFDEVILASAVRRTSVVNEKRGIVEVHLVFSTNAPGRSSEIQAVGYGAIE